LGKSPTGGVTWLEEAVPPPFLFAVGILTMPAFLLQVRLEVKAAQVALFFALAALSTRSGLLRLLWTTLALMGSTVLFNLITPLGEVLVKAGPFVVTEGALRSGTIKGLTLVGLMLLSRFAVRRSVRLPGLLGRYVSTTLLYLNRMLDSRHRLRGQGLVARLDGIFLSAYRQSPPRPQVRRQEPRPLAVAALAVLLAANWGLLFLRR
jgi:hypothetical protein